MFRYDLDQLREHCPASRVAAEMLNVKMNGDRCQATWRGGDGWNVQFYKDGTFKDFKTEEHGSGATLLSIARNIPLEQAANELGDRYCPHLARPEAKPRARKASRAASAPSAPAVILPARIRPAPQPPTTETELASEGYTITREWHYTNAAGEIVATVVRFDKPGEPKQIRQRTAAGWGLGDVKPPLYNLPAVMEARTVCVTEGEKCADALNLRGFTATTNIGGATKWLPEYTGALAGKHIVIFPDNDEKGRMHEAILQRELGEVAASLKIVETSKNIKGDVADFLDAGATTADIRALIDAAPLVKPPRLGVPTPAEIALAKELNRAPFKNYFMKQGTAGDGSPEVVRAPLKIKEMVSQLHQRFLGFPALLGNDTLFDIDKDTRRFGTFDSADSLFAWIQAKSGQSYEFQTAPGYVTRKEFYAALFKESVRFDSMTEVPQHKLQKHIFYNYPELPPPSEGHRAFLDIAGAFTPAGPEDAILIKCLFASLAWSVQAHPAWVIDSKDGKNTGKTTLAQLLAHFCNQTTLDIERGVLSSHPEEVTKRMVSSEGRNKNIALFDNVEGDFASELLSKWITSPSISGRAPYSRGEDTRRNNFTFIITANGAQLDGDLASRCYPIKLRRNPDPDPLWEKKLRDMIERSRYQAFADILDMLRLHEARVHGWKLKPITRFKEFEMSVLWAMCADEAEAAALCAHLKRAQSAVNMDQDNCDQIVDIIHDNLASLPALADVGRIDPDTARVFLTAQIYKAWVKPHFERYNGVCSIPSLIGYARNGLTSSIGTADNEIKQSSGIRSIKTSAGVLWKGEASTPASPLIFLRLDMDRYAAHIVKTGDAK